MTYDVLMDNEFLKQMNRPGMGRTIAEYFVSLMTYVGAVGLGTVTPGFLPLEQSRVSVVGRENEDFDLDRLAA